MLPGQLTKAIRLKISRLSRCGLITWTAAYLAFVLVLALSENVIAERYWLCTLLAYMPQAPFAVPGALLLVLSCLRRDRVLAAGNVLRGLLVLFLLMGFRIPLRLGAPRASCRVRVMTFNLHQGAYGVFDIVQVLDKYRPDVVCVQEVSSRGKWGDPVQQILRLQPSRWHVVRDGELAMLSRRPIRASGLTYLPMKTGRAILAGETSVRGSSVTVCATHFNTAVGGDSAVHRSSSLSQYLCEAAMLRLGQTSALLDFANRFRGPVVLAGDLNTPPRGLWYRRMTSDYSDAFAAAGWGFGYTYRPRLPMLRIDYVFARKPLWVAACFAAGDVASDHRAVVADIDLSD